MALTLVRTLTRKSNGKHGSSDSGPGPELFLHRSCPRTPAAYPLEFWVSVREEGCAPPFSPAAIPGVPKSDRRPVWRRRRFFISFVEDSVLKRRAALESLCFGIGFGRLELNCNYNFYITVLCFYIVLYICICLPYDFFGNQTTAHPVEKVCAAASLAIPSLHGLSSSIVKLVAELSLTFKSVWQAALCQPRVSAAIE